MNEPKHAKLETLQEFKMRTSWKDQPLRSIHVPHDQNKKIRENGFFEALLGDTVLFSLPGDVRKQLAALRDALYVNHRNLFCTPLPDESLHITLHDLSTAPLSGLHQIAADMQARSAAVQEKLAAFRLQHREKIRLRPTKLVSMVGRSVVLLLEPESEKDWEPLAQMYQSLNGIVPLSYGFTPHVTLAYYKPQPISDRDAIHLYESFPAILGAHPVCAIDLETGDLRYRCFTSMARYLSYDQFLSQMNLTDDKNPALDRMTHFLDLMNRADDTDLAFAQLKDLLSLMNCMDEEILALDPMMQLLDLFSSTDGKPLTPDQLKQADDLMSCMAESSLAFLRMNRFLDLMNNTDGKPFSLDLMKQFLGAMNCPDGKSLTPLQMKQFLDLFHLKDGKRLLLGRMKLFLDLMSCTDGKRLTFAQRDCMDEERRARVEFDNLFFLAQHRLAWGVPLRKVTRELAGFGLDLSTAKSQRVSSSSIHRMIATYPYSIKDRYAHTPSCTGAGGAIGHSFLCAVIVMNLCDRGLLHETAAFCGKENLIRHCLIDLRWQQ